MHQTPSNQTREDRTDAGIQIRPNPNSCFPLFGTNHSALRNKAFIADEDDSTHINFHMANFPLNIHNHTCASTGSNITRITTSGSYVILSSG